MTKIRIRRGTGAQWSAVNPVLGDGELGYDKTAEKLKIGDGWTAWNSLGYLTSESTPAPVTDTSTKRVASLVYVDPNDITMDASWSGLTNNAIGIYDLPPQMQFTVHDNSLNFGFDEYQYTYGIMAEEKGIFEFQVNMICRNPTAYLTLNSQGSTGYEGTLILNAYDAIFPSTTWVSTSAPITPRSSGVDQVQTGASLRAFVDPAEWLVKPGDPTSTHNVAFEFQMFLPTQPITIKTLIVNLFWTPVPNA